MKKILNYLGAFILGIILTLPISNVSAANATIDIYASNKSPIVGNTITVTVYVKSSSPIGSYEYTLSYDSSKLKLTSGSLSSAEVANNDSTKTMSKTFQFKVIATGSSKVTVKSYGVYSWDEKSMSVGVDPVTVTGKTASSGGSTTTSYSTNNYLSKLEVSGQSISPSFNKNTTNYTLTLDSSIEEINISATKEDNKSTISGTGTKKVSEGENKFDIIVTSEKGTKRTYTLTVRVEDKNPIKITLDNQEYTIVKKASVLTKPENYTSKEITINDQKIPTFYSEITNYTLVGLKDKEGTVNLYIYDEETNNYTIYKEYQFNNIKISPLKPAKINENYQPTKIIINDEELTAYEINENSNYALIYGINIETGEKSWYMYEKTENTIQKYNPEELETITTKLEAAKKLIYTLGISSIILAFLLVIVTVIKTKNKKKKSSKKEPTTFEKNKEEVETNKKNSSFDNKSITVKDTSSLKNDKEKERTNKDEKNEEQQTKNKSKKKKKR